jgi:hypothetical protein
MWVSRSDPGAGFVRSRQRFAHRSHVGLIEREAPSCEWKVTTVLVLVGALTAAPLAYLLIYAMLH